MSIPSTAAPRLPRGFGRRVSRAPIGLYRLGLGWLLGHRFLLLTHTGRKTGLPRQTVLEVMRYDPAMNSYVVAVGFGTRSDWYRNVLKSPEVTIQVGARRQQARARPVDAEEAFEELSEYMRRHPIAARAVARLLGLAIDGTKEQRRALAARLPVIELTCLRSAD